LADATRGNFLFDRQCSHSSPIRVFVAAKLVAGFTLGGFIDVLLVFAVVLAPSFVIAGIALVVVGSRKT
jgi:hypothetical protein